MVGIVLGVYIGAILLLNIPAIQRFTGVFVAKELSRVLGTELTIGKINLGLLNRIIINDVVLRDPLSAEGKEVARIAHLSVKFDLMPLLQRRISISTVQLFGLNLSVSRQTPDAPSNIDFLLKAFKSDRKPEKKSLFDLRVNSLLVRRGSVAYHVLSEEETPGRFNASHLNLVNIVGSLSLKALEQDSVNIGIKRLSFDEANSNFSLKKISMKLAGNSRRMDVNNLAVELPRSRLELESVRLHYDSLQALGRFDENVRLSALLTAEMVPQDVACFVPAFAGFEGQTFLNMKIDGTPADLSCPYLELLCDNHQVCLLGSFSIQHVIRPREMRFAGTVSQLSTTAHGIDFLLDNLGMDKHVYLNRLEYVDFGGEVSGSLDNLALDGQLHTNLGNIDAELGLRIADALLAYRGNLNVLDFDIGKLTGNSHFGKTTLGFRVEGKSAKGARPDVELEGKVDALEYKQYTYENIALSGSYRQGALDGEVLMDDAHGRVLLSGNADLSSDRPAFRVHAVLEHVQPDELRLTDRYPGMSFYARVNAVFEGQPAGDLAGKIDVDTLRFVTAEGEYSVKNLEAVTTRQDGINRLRLTSDFLAAEMEGKFQYKTLPGSILNIVRSHMPSLNPSLGGARESRNNFRFDIDVYNTEVLSKVFRIPLNVYAHSTLKGQVNDTLQRLFLEGYFPRLQYGNSYIESGMIWCDNTAEKLQAKVRLTNMRKSGAVNLSLSASAENDKVDMVLDWGNCTSATYSGRLAAVADFFRTSSAEEAEADSVAVRIDIKPTDVILNDSIWKIHPSRVVCQSGEVDIDNFCFAHADRHVKINGRMSKNLFDTIKVDLKNINIGYVFDIANISRSVDFEGDATGTAFVCGVLAEPSIGTHLQIDKFSLNQSYLGNLDISGTWDNDVRGIRIDAEITPARSALSTKIDGVIYPLKPESGLDLNIRANDLDIGFLQFYMRSISDHVEGRVTGNVHFYGKFKELNLAGAVNTNAVVNVNALNTSFVVNDSIRMTPDGLTFDHAYIADREGHTGTLNGYLRYQHFKNISYRLEVQSHNMLLMNTKESVETPFYGTVYGTGNAVLSGNAIQGFDANIAMSTNPGTYFTYVNGNVASAVSNQFIRFVDKTPRRAILDSVQLLSHYELMQQESQMNEEKQKTDIRLNLLLDATPDATVKIVMDPAAGDYISGKGWGNIRAEYYNKGELKMFGNYQITQGIYKFSLQEVIRKDFVIRDGSTIAFSGTPLNANMDIEAYYTVNSASLNDLIPEDMSGVIQQPNVRVNCIMNLSGVLRHPTIKLGIELPNERDEIQTLVRNYISTDEQMNMQILYLLGIGKFYMEDSRNRGQNSNVMSSVLSSTLSGQLNNALSQLFDTNDWNVGTNLSTGDKGWTDVEVEGILSGRLLNNRLLVNGNFGYRDNPMANTNFVGDFEAEWLLNKSGDIRLKAYNETNDRYYTKTNLTTQGIGIVYKKDFDKWSELFWGNRWKLFWSKKRNQRKKEAEQE